MSLINDALKKAQRQRAGEAPVAAAGGDASSQRVAKRPQAMRAQMVLLIAAAATVLVVFSVIVTVYWLNTAPEPKPVPAAAAAPKPAGPDPRIESESKAVVVVPPLRPTAGQATEPAPDSAPPVVSVPTPAPASNTVKAAATPAASVESSPPATKPPAPDPRIQAFVDAVRVTGIRASGSESKVLMNDRVYRVNDVVDRTLGLKLIKVDPATLTFEDAHGFTYTKTF